MKYDLYEKYYDDRKGTVPYGSEQEYHADLIALLNIYINSLEDYEPEIFRRMVDGAKLHIRRRLISTGDRLPLRYLYLARLLHMSEWEQFLFLLGFSVVYDKKYEAVYEKLQGGVRFPTLRLAVTLYRMAGELTPEEIADAEEKNGPLLKYLMDVREAEEDAAASFTIVLRSRVWAFLCGYEGIDDNIRQTVELFRFSEEEEPVLIRQEQKEQIEKYIVRMLGTAGRRGQVLQLYGPEGIGRRFLLKSAAAGLKLNLLFVDIVKLLAGNVREMWDMMSRIMLESLLAGAVICFDGSELAASQAEGERRESVYILLRFLLREIREECSMCVWLSREKADFLMHHRLHLLYMELPMLTAIERKQLWEAYTTGENALCSVAEDVDIDIEANRYFLTPGGLKEVLWDAGIHADEERITGRDIREAVERQADNQLGRSANKIHSLYTWDDLIIGEEQKREMEYICNQVKYRSVVGEQWGFHRKTSYGKGVCALFYGAPGTGKTMAAQVVANELGLELYRIDLSQIVSKYIGETEKNISDLFRRAKHMNVLLFFDEADSLFAKRMEVKDSHDRNANAETAHLLQQIEDYEGITILATNYINNIDDAFKRRIKYMVNFVFPPADVRLELWRTILPGETPLDEEIDFAFFAEKFEISGSGIKEILTNAAYMAAAESRGLKNEDVVTAVRLHFSKYGKVLGKEEFGYLTV